MGLNLHFLYNHEGELVSELLPTIGDEFSTAFISLGDEKLHQLLTALPLAGAVVATDADLEPTPKAEDEVVFGLKDGLAEAVRVLVNLELEFHVS